MVRRATKTLGIVTVIALLLISGIGTGAYTSFTAERQATMDVVADSGGIIKLTPGPSKFVFKSGGELKVDVTTGGASGVNVDSTLKIGDSSSSSTLNSSNAFNVTNNDNSAHDLTFSYTPASDSDADANVRIKAYNETGDLIVNATENNGATIQGASAGQTYRIVVVVNTKGMPTTDDLSGTLKIKSS